MIEFATYPTREALMHAAAAQIAAALGRGISERGEGFAALSGGGTPQPAYAELATLPLNWARITFLLVDERFVPPTDAGSNEAMLRRALAPALAAGAKLLPMYSDGVGLKDAALGADVLYADKPIDIALMGMGSDGHTASWFPRSPQLDAVLDPAETRSVMAIEAPGAIHSAQRLTLTRSAMGRAHDVILLISGLQKRTTLIDQTRQRLPVDSLFDLDVRTRVLWAP